MHGNMTRKSADVLPLYDKPRQKAYRFAIAKVIRDLKSKHSLSNVSLGEEIGCSAETVSNAENEANDLNPVTLLRIAFEFGEDAIAPVRELYLCRHREPETLTDKLDALQDQINAVRKELQA